MVLGSLYFWTWYGAFHFVDPLFAFAYLMFPFWENVLLLAAVNWSWHAFNNPKDPEDEYVGSLTILDGCINVLNEDSHVVHHQYPGAHWTDHPRLTDKHWDAYAEHQATIFRKVSSARMTTPIFFERSDDLPSFQYHPFLSSLHLRPSRHMRSRFLA